MHNLDRNRVQRSSQQRCSQKRQAALADLETDSSLHIIGPKDHVKPTNLNGPADPRHVRSFILYKIKAPKIKLVLSSTHSGGKQRQKQTLSPHLCCEANLEVIMSWILSFSSIEQAFGNKCT